MKTKIITIIILLGIFISMNSLNLVLAHCPLCTGAAVAGVGVARFYGVDDSIVGLLLGAFVASTGLWVDKWLKKRKKKINFPMQAFILVLLSFLLLVIPLYMKGIITDFEMVQSMPQYSMLGMGVYGIDKLFFGIIFGTLLISGVFSFSEYLKEKNGKRLFAYQGLVFMTVVLAIFSLIFWLITKNPVV